MTHKILPIKATNEMQKAMLDAYVDSECGRFPSDEIYEAAIAAAPETNLVMVDKVKFEALKSQLLKVGNALYGAIGHVPKKSRIAIGADLATATEQNEREYYLGILSSAKQTLKDMEG